LSTEEGLSLTLTLRPSLPPSLPPFLPFFLPPSIPPRLPGLPARYLETLLPSTGGLVLLLRGPHRLQRGKLLEVDRRREEAIVQLIEDDLQVLRLSLDDVAGYGGRE
ncbi:hypothetical protein Naga_100900g3, partial [Nannochloropsis gaditana]